MSEIKALEKLRELTDDVRSGTSVQAYRERLETIAANIEAEIERDYMRLPVDESGQVIRIGDELDGYSQKAVKVEAVGYENVVVRSNTKGGYGYHDGAYPLLLWSAASTAHVKPDPLVELLRGFAGRVDSLSWFGLDTFDEAVTEYADEIRDLMKEGGE